MDNPEDILKELNKTLDPKIKNDLDLEMDEYMRMRQSKTKEELEKECLACSNERVEGHEYCQWCLDRIAAYEPDEKEEGE